jgi:hypothetical protein
MMSEHKKHLETKMPTSYININKSAEFCKLPGDSAYAAA